MSELSRRNFLKNGLLAGTVMLSPAALLNTKLSAQTGGKKEKVRLAVVGAGSRGQYLMQCVLALQEHENMELVAICDVYEPSIQSALLLAPGVKVFRDYRALLEMKDLDGIIVATPLHEHAAPTIDALNNGIHVFCEKAMALTLEDTYAMAEAHLRTGNVLQIGHQRLFDPRFLKGMNYVHSGEIGKVTQMRAFWHRHNNWRRPVPSDQPELERFINWRLYRDYSLGLMTELASHHIQVANWVKKALPKVVRGAGSISYWKDGREVEDNVALIYSYEDGTQFIYDSMIQNRKYGLEIQVLGDKGTLELENNRKFYEEPPVPPKPPGIVQLIQDLESNVFGKIPLGSSSWEPELAIQERGYPILANNPRPDWWPAWEWRDGSLEQVIGFADAIREGKAIPGMFEQCYYGSIWTILGQMAIDSGQAVTMPDKYLI
ncbi:Gfo/Idh/MocA family protein [Natronoflexus pectinivorans]|uniref:Putative dehydrogenase n=1 Tax=Natronoflexus pectinivorans TaxID=682526 RepID=A0A4V2RWC5_9BACT|nr:Gfo/Idh/MocA family oxidoreductase [Natronoflexus pectinivorans]TCO07775.1 putative dehydrogenase [Natronoflexus pectinivorans]